MAKNLFDRYIWLVDIIYRGEKITFEEINQKWLRTDWCEGKDLPLRTFHNHREAIQDLFNININCDRQKGYVYYIENRDDMKQSGIRSWLLNTFAVNNLINESRRLKHRILFEEIPSGQRFLTPIIEAMRDNLSIEIEYQPFWHDELIIMNLEPYCLKIFKQRWYVIARNAHLNTIRTYSLDRIQEVRTTEKTFKIPENFNPESHFENSFGIVKDDNIKPSVVKLKVFGQQRNYLHTLPLHSTQQEIEIEDNHSVFSYYISPTKDFEKEILSYGNEIEVLSPEWLRADIAKIVKKMNKLYE
jgi:hypothetical protein